MALDYNLLELVKQAFIPGDPTASGGDPMAAGAPPMDPSMMGGAPMDPSMAGGMPPMDPSMMGGAPMDPSMAGGMPPMDPSMAGGMPPAVDPMTMAGMAPPPPPPADPVAAATNAATGGSSMISMPVDEFLKFLKQMMALAGKQDAIAQNAVPQQQPASGGNTDERLAALEAKMDAFMSAIG